MSNSFRGELRIRFWEFKGYFTSVYTPPEIQQNELK